MKYYEVDQGYYTITFDSLEEAKRYVEGFFKNRGIVLEIREKE